MLAKKTIIIHEQLHLLISYGTIVKPSSTHQTRLVSPCTARPCVQITVRIQAMVRPVWRIEREGDARQMSLLKADEHVTAGICGCNFLL